MGAADAFAAGKFWTWAEPFGPRSREFWTLAGPMHALPGNSGRRRDRSSLDAAEDSNPVYLATLFLAILLP